MIARRMTTKRRQFAPAEKAAALEGKSRARMSLDLFANPARNEESHCLDADIAQRLIFKVLYGEYSSAG